MNDHVKIDPEQDRPGGSGAVKRFNARVFKSGNSLALRLPAELGLSAGMEMALRVEDGARFSFEPVDRPKRKFNIQKVAGSAPGLRFISDEDRAFVERASAWPRTGGSDEIPDE